MPELRCVDAGAACSGRFKASTNEELLRIVGNHLKEKHNVKTFTQTLQNFVLKVAK